MCRYDKGFKIKSWDSYCFIIQCKYHLHRNGKWWTFVVLAIIATNNSDIVLAKVNGINLRKLKIATGQMDGYQTDVKFLTLLDLFFATSLKKHIL